MLRGTHRPAATICIPRAATWDVPTANVDGKWHGAHTDNMSRNQDHVFSVVNVFDLEDRKIGAILGRKAQHQAALASNRG
jgi:hypothetical protein